MLRILICLCALVTLSAQETVLLVHSYHAGYPWVDQITAGAQEALADSGIALEVFYMDTKRRTDPAWKVESGKLAAAKVAELKPAVVITADDNAQAVFAKDLVGVAGAPQVVFCGVNATPEAYGFPAANVTGILERPHVGQCFEMLQSIAPQVKTIAILGDGSTTSAVVNEFIQSQEGLPIEIVSYDNPATFAEWQETVRGYTGKVDAIALMLYLTVKREAGDASSMPREELAAWTMANTKLPTVGFWEFAIDDGALCGIAASATEHGRVAGEMAKGIILDGKTAADYPVVVNEEGLIMFNLKTAEAHGIEIPFDLLDLATKVVE